MSKKPQQVLIDKFNPKCPRQRRFCVLQPVTVRTTGINDNRNQRQFLPLEDFMLRFEADRGSVMALLAVDKAVYEVQGERSLTEKRVCIFHGLLSLYFKLDFNLNSL